MERKLEKIFENVNKWLSFAETKNAAIIAFDGAAIFGFLRLISPNSEFESLYFGIYVCVLSLFLSLIMSLSSFMGKLDPEKFNKSENNLKDDNLLYYGHICKYNSKTYLEKLFKKYGENRTPTEYEKELGGQIVINSKIAMAKYEKFNTSLKFILAGILVFILNLLYVYCGMIISAIALSILLISWVFYNLTN